VFNDSLIVFNDSLIVFNDSLTSVYKTSTAGFSVYSESATAGFSL